MTNAIFSTKVTNQIGNILFPKFNFSRICTKDKENTEDSIDYIDYIKSITDDKGPLSSVTNMNILNDILNENDDKAALIVYVGNHFVPLLNMKKCLHLSKENAQTTYSKNKK